MYSKALHNLYQRMRARKDLGSLMVTQTVAVALHPCEAKNQHARVLSRS